MGAQVITQKRCAYFGCMTPMFETNDARRLYCSEDCAKKAKQRSKSRQKYRKAHPEIYERISAASKDAGKRKQSYKNGRFRVVES